MANYNVEGIDYTEEIRRLEDSDPARAETIFNPLFERIINNVSYLKNTYGDITDELVVMVNNLLSDVAYLAFELAIKDYIDADGMKLVMIDDFESVDDIILISGKFDEEKKKVYI